MIPHAFIVAEEEEAVTQDGAAQCGSENLLGIAVLLHSGEIVGPGVGVQIVALQKIVNTSMKAIGSALCGKKNLSSIDVAVLRIRVGSYDLDLLNRFG